MHRALANTLFSSQAESIHSKVWFKVFTYIENLFVVIFFPRYLTAVVEVGKDMKLLLRPT